MSNGCNETCVGYFLVDRFNCLLRETVRVENKGGRPTKSVGKRFPQVIHVRLMYHDLFVSIRPLIDLHYYYVVLTRSWRSKSDGKNVKHNRLYLITTVKFDSRSALLRELCSWLWSTNRSSELNFHLGCWLINLWLKKYFLFFIFWERSIRWNPQYLYFVECFEDEIMGRVGAWWGLFNSSKSVSGTSSIIVSIITGEL